MTFNRSHAGARSLAFRLLLLSCVVGAELAAARPYAYITNLVGSSVSMIDTSQTPPVVVATIAVEAEPTGVTVSPDGATVYITHFYDRLTVIDASSRPPTVLDSIVLGSDLELGGLDVTPDGRRVFVALFGSNEVAVVDVTVRPPVVIATLAVGGLPDGVVVNPEGSRVYVANAVDATSDDSTISIIDNTANPPVVIDTLIVGREPHGIAVAPDGRRVYVVNRDGPQSLVVVDVEADANQVIDQVTIGSSPYSIALAPDGARAYVSCLSDGTVAVVDLSASPPQILTFVDVGGAAYGLGVTPDGTRLYAAAGLQNAVVIVDTTANPPSPIGTVAVGEIPIAFGELMGPALMRLFADGFESGDTSRWSEVLLATPEIRPGDPLAAQHRRSIRGRS